MAAVQFVNILDFVIVMPMGPDFSRALSIPTSQVGLIGAGYTLAAALSGFFGAFWLDRFDRRNALAFSLVGLFVGTAACGFAQGLPSLLAARFFAGLFGGPATSLALSIVSDQVPFERRGRALGTVMSAFSVASVLGVPVGLEMARTLGWRSPFFAVALLGLLVGAVAVAILPPLRAHLPQKKSSSRRSRQLVELLMRPSVKLGLTNYALMTFGLFLLIPNISAYIQMNGGFPRDRLWVLYLVGGALTFGVVRLGGRLTDHFGTFPVLTAASVLLVLNSIFGFAFEHPLIPVTLLFIVFMVSSSTRNMTINALNTRIPNADERATFQSIQSAIQHLSSAAGSGMSTLLISTGQDGLLHGTWKLVVLSALSMSVAPFLTFRLTRMLGALGNRHQHPHTRGQQTTPAEGLE